jgi:membrane fusion protein (multidrug efflux system)
MTKHSKRLSITTLLAVAGFLGMMILGNQLHAAEHSQEADSTVGVVTLHKQPIPRLFVLPGRAVAYEQVDIRPRVDGVISKILYTPGKKLDVGAPLFQLDDASYVAAVASAEADMASAKANLPVVQAAYDRAKKLEGAGYTKAQVETARSELAGAKATLKASEAALTYARIQHSWTTITSPIKGYAEVPNVSVGDLVTSAQSDALTTVTRLDPIDVDMLDPSTRLLSIRNQIKKGILQPSKGLNAILQLENGETYEGIGKMVAPSKTVSSTTGTISIRFRFENPEQKILPGMFLRGTIQFGTIQAYLVPQRAASMDTTGKLKAYRVSADGKAEQISMHSEGVYNNNWIATDGINEGDRIIIDNLKFMRVGKPVTPVEAIIDDNGLVQDRQAPVTTAGGEGN